MSEDSIQKFKIGIKHLKPRDDQSPVLKMPRNMNVSVNYLVFQIGKKAFVCRRRWGTQWRSESGSELSF